MGDSKRYTIRDYLPIRRAAIVRQMDELAAELQLIDEKFPEFATADKALTTDSDRAENT